MTKDMTTGSPMKLVLSFAIPLMFGNLFQQFYSMVDTIIVGRFLGTGPLAAVGSTGSINFMIIGFCMGVCNGIAIPVAQRFGSPGPPRPALLCGQRGLAGSAPGGGVHRSGLCPLPPNLNLDADPEQHPGLRGRLHLHHLSGHPRHHSLRSALRPDSGPGGQPHPGGVSGSGGAAQCGAGFAVHHHLRHGGWREPPSPR